MFSHVQGFMSHNAFCVGLTVRCDDTPSNLRKIKGRGTLSLDTLID